MTSLSHKIISLCAATTLACAGAGFAAPAAFADPTGTSTPGGIEASLDSAVTTAAQKIDPAQTVELHIKKIDGPAGKTDDGLPTSTKALEGVGFTVQKVAGIDLTKNAGWKKFNEIAAAANPDEEIKKLTFEGEAVTRTTNSEGVADFSFERGVGVYLVTESTTPDGYSKTAPFLVALPKAETVGEGEAAHQEWKYSRTIYPKNQKIVPTKEVNDNEAGLGKNLTYRLSTNIPSTHLEKFIVTDLLSENLEYVDGSLGVKLKSGDVEQGFESADFAITSDKEGDPLRQNLKVVFAQTGLKKIEDFYKAPHTDAKIELEFKAKVVSLPSNGVITNSATFNINDKEYSTDKPNPDPLQKPIPASTTFGNLVITKTTSPADTGADLSGAKFQVYLCKAGTEQDDPAWTLLGSPLKLSTVEENPADGTMNDTLVTDSEAKAKAYGLPTKSFSTGSGDSVNKYCLLETQAPDGFIRNPEIIPVNEKEVDGKLVELTAEVDNQKKTFLNQLPSTGAWGIVLVFLLGFLLLARGLYTTRRDGQATA